MSRYEPGETEPPAWASPLLRAGSAVFGVAARARAAAYDAGLLPVLRVDRPVVSVGNLAVGGTGKTPCVILLAERLREAGLRVAVVSRGYGRDVPSPVLVSRGEGPLVDARAGGDEPVLIAQRTRAVVWADPDRVRGARRAIQEQGADVILLDDGFQHRRLARDLDVVVLDAARPFGNRHPLPLGPLREPPSALARADLLVLNRGASGAPAARDGLPERPVVEVRVEVTAVGRDPPEAVRGQPVALVSGVARPARFADTVRALGAEVVAAEAHRDHARLPKAKLEAFVRRARSAGAARILTTAKDAARWDLPPDVEVVAVAHRVVAGEEELSRALAMVTGRAR